MTNPYDAPTHANDPLNLPPRDLRYAAYLLAAFACVIGVKQVLPFLTGPIAMWGWQNWVFGFAPGAYLLFAATLAVQCERRASRFGLLVLPLVLAPLLLVTGLIVFAIYIDLAKTISGGYTWTQNLHTVMLALLCPVVWYYQLASMHRAWQFLRIAG